MTQNLSLNLKKNEVAQFLLLTMMKVTLMTPTMLFLKKLALTGVPEAWSMK